MSDNEWKSDLAVMLPLCILFAGFAVSMTVIGYWNGKADIERLRLAQMQYQAEWKEVPND